MEEQENEQQQEKGLGQQMLDAGLNAGKNKIEQTAKDAARNATKKAGQALIKSLATVLPIILPKLIAIALIGSLVGLMLGGAINYVVKNEVTKIGKDISESIMSSIKMGDNGPIIPSKEEMIALIDEKLKEINIEKTDLDMGNESQASDYLYKFVLAMISTQLPDIEGSDAPGIVKIKRCSEDGNTRDLTYKNYSDFTDLIEKNDTTAVNYYAIDDNWQLCIAKYTTSTTTSSAGEQESAENEDSSVEEETTGTEDSSSVEEETTETEDSSEEETETTTTVTEVKIPYQNMISKYSIPFEFLITLQQISLNPEYVSAVADLVMNQGEIELTIFDAKETRKTEYTYQYDLNTKRLEEVETDEEDSTTDTEESDTSTDTDNSSTSSGGGGSSGGSSINGENNFMVTTRSKMLATQILETTIEGTNGNGTEEEESETEYVMQTSIQEDITETSTTVTEINTVTANITKANVWVIEQTTEYTLNDPTTEYPLGEEGTIIEIEDEEEPEGEGQWKTNQTQTTKETVTKKSWQAGQSNTDINPNKFLGLWRNSTGSYEEGADYVEDGVLVKYDLPSMKTKDSPVANIINSKEMLYTLLENVETTQNHAMLMEYVIHYYLTGEKLDIDLSIFNASEFTEVTGVIGGTIQEKVWFTLKNAGYSDESIAGAMGNIHYESGSFDPTKVEGGYTEDNGGIGICQWTNNDRGTTGRNAQLKAYAASKGKTWQDEDIQVEFLLAEITGTGDAVGYASKQFMTKTYAGQKWEKNSWEQPQGDTTDAKIEYATKAFCYTFERPKESAAIASMSKRIEYAKMYYEQFAGAVIRYYQDDYSDVAYGSSTLANCGCGPTCFAMVATHLSGTTITPADAVAWCGNSYYVSGEGTSWAYFEAAAKHFGLSCTIRETTNFTDVENALKTGKLVISSQAPGLFTGSGHFILLTKIQNGLIYVNDPNKNNAIDKEYNTRGFTASEITQAGKNYWIFE